MNELPSNPQLNLTDANGSVLIPSDFRLGNYVQSKEWGEMAQVQSIEKIDNRIDIRVKGHIHSIVKGKYFDLIPVELTEDKLLSFGFKKFIHELGFEEDKCVEFENGIISIVDWGNGFILSNSFSFKLRVKIKYVHQLQNIVYCLTGQEIILSDK